MIDTHKSENNSTWYLARYMYRNYGVMTFLRGVLFYIYRKLKRYGLDISQQHILQVNGYKISIIPNDEGISAALSIFKIHEPLTTKIISKVLKIGMFCIDIGSNIGYYALLESKIVGETGKVIAIEPSPINFKYLEINSKLQKPNNIETYNFAVAQTDATVKFLINEKSNWSKVLENSNDITQDTSVISVPAKQLDTFFSEKKIPKLDFLRMDVEGYELNIYNGARKTIQNFKPSLLIEVHRHFLGLRKTKEFLLLLKDDGYEIKYFIPRELDIPIVGNSSAIMSLTIQEILEKIDKNLLPDVFHIFLEKKQN